MAGSYNHAVNKATGKLLNPEDLVRMVENLGDAYETIEEMYGMIWFLADQLVTRESAYAAVELARRNYRTGLELSPGIDGKLEEEE